MGSWHLLKLQCGYLGTCWASLDSVYLRCLGCGLAVTYMQKVSSSSETTTNKPPDLLVDARSGSMLATPSVVSNVDLLSATFSPDVDYSMMKTLKITPEDGVGVMGFSVMGFKYINATDMDFFLTVGYTFHISSGRGLLVPGLHLSDEGASRSRRLFVCAGVCVWAAGTVGSWAATKALDYGYDYARSHWG